MTADLDALANSASLAATVAPHSSRKMRFLQLLQIPPFVNGFDGWGVWRSPLRINRPEYFDFSPERFSLRYVEDRDLVGGPVPAEWDGCRIFGMCDYAEGGGASPWISIRERDGSVCGLDIERTGSTVFIFNSSLDRFIRTFELLDHYLRTGASLPPELRSQIRALDRDVFERSDWRETIDFINGQ